MLTLKRITALILSAAMTLAVFAGCSKVEDPVPAAPSDNAVVSESPETDGAAPAAQGLAPAKITGWFYPRYVVPGMEAGEFEQQLMDEFRAIPGNENIVFSSEMLAWDSGPEKMNIALSTGSMPDFLFDFPGRIIDYGINGALVPLDDKISAETTDDIPSLIWDSCKSGGKTYMYPVSIAYITMAVNRKIFRDAGIENLLPTNELRTWTNSEFENALAALSKVDGLVAPMVFYNMNEQGDASIRMLIQNQGADFINPEHTEIVLNSEAGKKGLQFFYDLGQKGYLTGNPETLSAVTAHEMFHQSKVAITPIQSAGNLPTLQKMIDDGTADPEFDVMFVTMPTPGGTSPKVENQVMGYCIFDNKDEARADAAFAFIEFTSSKLECVAAQNLFPVRKSMNLEQLGEAYNTSEHKFLNSLADYLGDTGYTMTNYGTVRAAFYPQMQAVFTGQKSVDQGLDDFAAEANTIIRK